MFHDEHIDFEYHRRIIFYVYIFCNLFFLYLILVFMLFSNLEFLNKTFAKFIFFNLICAIPLMMYFKNNCCFKIIAIFHLIVLLIVMAALLPEININNDSDKKTVSR